MRDSFFIDSPGRCHAGFLQKEKLCIPAKLFYKIQCYFTGAVEYIRCS
jgi:hypothetical protein